MAATSRLLPSAVVGSLLVAVSAAPAAAQVAARLASPPPVRVSAFAAGSLYGIVQDEQGKAVPGVVISALGATTTVAVTDKNGRYEFGLLSPGPYVLRAHLAGYVAPKARTVQVGARNQATADIALRRASTVLAAGFGIVDSQPVEAEPVAEESADSATASTSETAWRLRHARRSILKDTHLPSQWIVDADSPVRSDGVGGWTAVDVLGRAFESARAASNFFTETPFSGQINLLTSGSFNRPGQLLADNAAKNVAYVRLGAPVGDQADWAVRGAVTESDISSWTVAGSYATRAPARHRYDLGLSYATQRYDGGNPLTLRDIPDGARNAGNIYAYDSVALNSAFTLTFGTAFARYDYLEGRSLLSPRVELTVSPADNLRVHASLSRRALAPGAEEFLPPSDTGLWLPPQRTFSSLNGDQAFDAEHTTHVEAAVERDFGSSTVSLRAFQERVDGQLVTVFGAEMPGQPVAKLGHYLVGAAGDAAAEGCSIGFRTLVASRVRGSVEYTLANAQLSRADDVRALMFLAPSAVRSGRERLHDVSTSIETEVPETATRILVLYRLSNGFAHPVRSGAGDEPALDGRFDVQVRQQLPFMNFSNARWEMLLAVRNFFRENGTEQSVYDELLVVRPPKRIVGGVTLRF
jgi:hypothetical protein